MASRSCCSVQAAVGWGVTFMCTSRRDAKMPELVAAAHSLGLPLVELPLFDHSQLAVDKLVFEEAALARSGLGSVRD